MSPRKASSGLPRCKGRRLAERRWVLASGNPGKVREFQALFTALDVSIVAQQELGIGDAKEPFQTFVENALAKARHASRGSGMVALADDSGICVPALGGAPGVHSARYADASPALSRDQVDLANNRKLILQTASMVQPVSCFYYCIVVLIHGPDDPRPLIADGTWPGVLVAEPRGRHGFGYDAHFLPMGQALTAAQMDPGEKNRVSHRAQALAALLAAFTGTLAGTLAGASAGASAATSGATSGAQSWAASALAPVRPD